MVGGPEPTTAATRPPFVRDHVVVIGGGCYGSWYTRQLARAVQRGAASFGRVTVVDREARCRVAGERPLLAALPLELVVADWGEYLREWLGAGRRAGGDPGAGAGTDAEAEMLVPSPLMPHLLLEWLEARARARWPDRAVGIVPLERATGGDRPDVPWQRAAPDGRHYVSMAEWLCPVNCIEPDRCPATRGARDWSLPERLTRWLARAQGGELPVHGPIIFHCVHRTWGVGMIDVAAIRAADATVASVAADGPVRVLVGTMSHCHGALGVLQVG
jgi:hypothetical protein